MTPIENPILKLLFLFIADVLFLAVCYLLIAKQRNRVFFEIDNLRSLIASPNKDKGKVEPYVKISNDAMWALVFIPILILVFTSYVNNDSYNPYGQSSYNPYSLGYFFFSLPPLFVVLAYIAIPKIREQADLEKGKALATKPERTDEYRRKYIALHREQILKNAEQIIEKHEALFSNLKRVEYFKAHVSPEVIKMWEEDRIRWRMIVEGQDQPAPIRKDDIFESEDKATAAKREMDSILRAFEFEKMTLESMKTNLANTEKDWAAKYGAEEAKAMIVQLKQRITQFMNRDL